MVDFQIWLDAMEERYYELKSFLPKHIGNELNFKVDSLNHLESYILENYKSINEFLEFDSKTLIRDKMARYFGEVARLNVPNCYWHINQEDKKSIYYNVPIIYCIAPNQLVDSPYHNITAAIDRKKGVFLKTLIGNYKRWAEANSYLEVVKTPYKMPVYH